MTRDVLTLRSPAKLNLCLHVTGRRPDGYHTLQTVFQLIDLCDDMRFSLRTDEQLLLQDPIPGVPASDNLVIRAARLLRDHCGKRQGVDIGLRKRIPLGGGLGGGSSNAATTLLALNRLWACDLETEYLARIGLQLGADVPVFVRGHSAVAQGIGEELQPTELPPCWYLVIHPGCAVNTAAIFNDPELTRDTPPMTIAGLLADSGHNDCEAVVRRQYPAVDQALAWLSGFKRARMSGTGSCIFAAFPQAAQAAQVRSLADEKWECFVVRGINHSMVHEALID